MLDPPTPTPHTLFIDFVLICVNFYNKAWHRMLTMLFIFLVELVKKQLKKRQSGEEREKLQQLLRRMVRVLVGGWWEQLKADVIQSPFCSHLHPASPRILRNSKRQHSRSESSSRSSAWP